MYYLGQIITHLSFRQAFFLQETSLAGGVAYWNYELNDQTKASSTMAKKTCRQSSRVQSKQLELNHRWSHGA